METPKEKADAIIKKFWMKNKNGQDSYGVAVENAKIAVEEILKVIPMYVGNLNPQWKFWDEVKTELNKL